MSGDVQKVIELINALSPDEKKVVYKKMTDEIKAKLLGFLDNINERAEKAPVSMEEITKEVEDVRTISYGTLGDGYSVSQHSKLKLAGWFNEDRLACFCYCSPHGKASN